jgi:hypothetical protein
MYKIIFGFISTIQWNQINKNNNFENFQRGIAGVQKNATLFLEYNFFLFVCSSQDVYFNHIELQTVHVTFIRLSCLESLDYIIVNEFLLSKEKIHLKFSTITRPVFVFYVQISFCVYIHLCWNKPAEYV